MELTGTGNDVLTALLNDALHHGIGLGEALETLDQLGQIGGVLALDGDTHDGRHGELHDLQVVGVLEGGDGSGLDEELIDTDQTDNVAAGHILDGLGVATHHEHGALDGLEEEIVLLARDVVGAHDADLLAGGDGAGEDTAESVEAALVRGGHHLADVHAERGSGVAVLHAKSDLVVLGALIEELHAVALGSDGRGEVDGDHLEQSITSGQPLLHDGLHEGLALRLALLDGELDLELLDELVGHVLLEVHDRVEDLEDGVQDELVEAADEAGAAGLGPLLVRGREEVVTPQALHHLVGVNLELGGVHLGEVLQGEGPAVQTGSEADGSLRGVDHDVAHGALLVTVRGDDHVDVLDDALEGLEEILLLELELEESAVHLVHEHDGADALGDGLAQHSLSLHAHTADAVDDDQSTVGHAERSRHFGREIDVPGGVDQVDEESLAINGLLDEGDVLVGQLVVQRDGGGLDGDAAVLLVGASVHEAGLSSAGLGDDTSLGHQRVGQRAFAVVDVRNHRHVADVSPLVHDATDLVDGKVHHFCLCS
eukprot:m.306022 g.306022  ORF g.306022 m.306022 type:complete len:541 (-) comp55303_c1_seq1:42-1664(-)